MTAALDDRRGEVTGGEQLGNNARQTPPQILLVYHTAGGFTADSGDYGSVTLMRRGNFTLNCGG